MSPCIGTPISWLRLETYAGAARPGEARAIDPRDAEIATHLGECPACRGCFAQISDDVVALPALGGIGGGSPATGVDQPPGNAPRKNWLWWLAPAMAVAAAAILLLVIVRREPAPDHVTTIKGGRQVVLGVVRERSGSIRRDVTTFAAGDRWKLTLTCEPGPLIWVDVAVVDPKSVDHPLSPAQLSCGNEIVVPGAFGITGRDANVVCAVLDPDAIPPRTAPVPGTPGTACVTLTPE